MPVLTDGITGLSCHERSHMPSRDEVEACTSAVSAKVDREPLRSDLWRGAGGVSYDECCGWKVVRDAYSRMVHSSCMHMSHGDRAGIR